MDELEILFPAPVVLQAGGRSIPVLPLPARRFAAMMRAMQPVIGAFHLGTQEVDIDALMDDPATLQIVALGIDAEPGFVAALKRNEQLNALLLVLGVNPDFFFPEIRDDADTGREQLFSDTFHDLIAAGHAWREIRDYSLGQIRLFADAAGRATRERDRTALLCARAAWSEGPLFSKLMDALGGNGNGQQ